MRSLWLDWEALAAKLASKKRLFLLLDFDGTLAPLEETPRQARLPAATKALIMRLKALRGVDVAVVSGRSIKDIRSRVGLREIYYAGNHGLEIDGPGYSFCHPRAAALKPAIQGLAGALRKDCRGLPGVIIENKGLTLSLHYRRLRPERLKDLGRIIRQYKERTIRLPVWWRTGHRVWELVPVADWDKGKASLCLLRRLRNPFPIALGDDRTDEDMFRALKEKGVTIRIGCPRPSAAQYCLSSQGQTGLFLSRLYSSLDKGVR